MERSPRDWQAHRLDGGAESSHSVRSRDRPASVRCGSAPRRIKTVSEEKIEKALPTGEDERTRGRRGKITIMEGQAHCQVFRPRRGMLEEALRAIHGRKQRTGTKTGKEHTPEGGRISSAIGAFRGQSVLRDMLATLLRQKNP